MREYEITHDKVRIRDGSARQWIVWRDGELFAECPSEQSAKDCVAIYREKERRG